MDSVGIQYGFEGIRKAMSYAGNCDAQTYCLTLRSLSRARLAWKRAVVALLGSRAHEARTGLISAPGLAEKARVQSRALRSCVASGVAYCSPQRERRIAREWRSIKRNRLRGRLTVIGRIVPHPVRRLAKPSFDSVVERQ
jgi:hypothetical protein